MKTLAHMIFNQWLSMRICLVLLIWSAFLSKLCQAHKLNLVVKILQAAKLKRKLQLKHKPKLFHVKAATSQTSSRLQATLRTSITSQETMSSAYLSISPTSLPPANWPAHSSSLQRLAQFSHSSRLERIMNCRSIQPTPLTSTLTTY